MKFWLIIALIALFPIGLVGTVIYGETTVDTLHTYGTNSDGQKVLFKTRINRFGFRHTTEIVLP